MGDIAKGIKSFKAGMKEGEETEEIDNIESSKDNKGKPKRKKTANKKQFLKVIIILILNGFLLSHNILDKYD